MRVAWLLLADGISQRPDGKVDVYGAGVDIILAPQTPAIHPRLSLAGRVLMTAEEADQPHSIDVTVRAPDATVIATAAGRVLPIPETNRPGEDAALGIGIAMDFVNLGLPAQGAYTIEMMLDGEPVPEAPGFRVIYPSTIPPTEA